jgi:two-component system CheB/CheR fusion protein
MTMTQPGDALSADSPRGDAHDSKSRGFPIVGVGASAGGLEAFSQLLAAIPAELGMALVLVQHLDPDHTSALATILSRATQLPVSEIHDGTLVEVNHVYVIPPDAEITLVDGVLRMEAHRRALATHQSIDTFFESLARDQRELAVGIVLSGTASDGTIGLEAIKAEGGITFAQDDSAKFTSMPRSAVAAGCVDLVLSPSEIGRELVRIAQHPLIAGHSLLGVAEEHDEAGDAALGYQRVLSLLRNHTGVDFTLYKPTTIHRRIARRLVLSKQRTLLDYATFLRGNHAELDALYADVLINVTSFFRNAETFHVVEQTILPALLRQRGDESLRFWVVGCSTGQEPYSIAMAFLEAADAAQSMRKLQIFATDLNDAVLERARIGLYSKSAVADVSPSRLQRFFVEADGGYRITKSVRDMVLFARQNLTVDPPFSRVDLISCRNVLIYLEPSAQKKVMPTFHYALKPGGFLLLGASESVGSATDLFQAVDGKHKVYVKKPADSSVLPFLTRRKRGEALPEAQPATPALSVGREEVMPIEQSAQREADRLSVMRFAPPGVIVNSDLLVMQFRGKTGAFLEPPTGKATFEVLKMAREGLMLPLRSALHQAMKEDVAVLKENVHLKRDGHTHRVNVEVIPLRNVRERAFLILFEDAVTGAREPAARPIRTTRAPTEGELSRITDLETELSETREYLQSMNEQVQTANEEFQAANEEVQSANEELQSANEELETSKEELESTNEELTTVNEELSHRNVELTRLNNDLVNLQASAKVAIVLLSSEMKIRRFDPYAEKLFDLLVGDIGRPIGHLRHHLVVGDAQAPLELEALCAQVLLSLREEEREVREKGGRWYSLRVRPYMTIDGKADGAVIVLMDIDSLKRNERALHESEALLSVEDRRKNEFLAMLGHELRNPLSALTHGLDLLGHVQSDEARREQLRSMMVRQTQRIAGLLDQLLDIARVVSGKVELSVGTVDLADVIRTALETMGPLIEKHRQRVILSLPEKHTAMVIGDAMRLTQVVENVVTNASKYTHEGGHIWITLDAQGDDARILVRDDGSGMSAELLPRIFDLFTQAPRTLERAQGGIGLGLTLVQSLVEMHHGHVSASSPGLGQGSEFIITLPRVVERRMSSARNLAQATPAARIKTRPLRVLIVDDEHELAEMFAEVLVRDGHQAHVASDGPTALELVRSSHPDVALLDLGLPGMDGYELATRLRQEHGDHTPLLIAVTGYRKDIARLKDAGFDHHLIKPLELAKLSELLAKWDASKASGVTA